jgi:hypothetical protein
MRALQRYVISMSSTLLPLTAESLENFQGEPLDEKDMVEFQTIVQGRKTQGEEEVSYGSSIMSVVDKPMKLADLTLYTDSTSLKSKEGPDNFCCRYRSLCDLTSCGAVDKDMLLVTGEGTAERWRTVLGGGDNGISQKVEVLVGGLKALLEDRELMRTLKDKFLVCRIEEELSNLSMVPDSTQVVVFVDVAEHMKRGGLVPEPDRTVMCYCCGDRQLIATVTTVGHLRERSFRFNCFEYLGAAMHFARVIRLSSHGGALCADGIVKRRVVSLCSSQDPAG